MVGCGSSDKPKLVPVTGKVVNVSPFISDLQEGFSGSSAPKDVETLFQLIYLYFTIAEYLTSAYKMQSEERFLLEQLMQAVEAFGLAPVELGQPLFNSR